MREKFFTKIEHNKEHNKEYNKENPKDSMENIYVFKTNDFRFFLEENKIDNSHSSYKNRIGLSADNRNRRFLKDGAEVVLNFPFKDCILAGGQSSEEGTNTYFKYNKDIDGYETNQSKCKEIFFNQILAQDEIDRLFDPKALVNWRRFSTKGEQKVKKNQTCQI